MSTLKVNTVQHNTTGFNNVVQFTDGAGTENGTLCRAWVNFNGTGTVAIRDDFNVSSITDNGVGDYTVNFTSALVDTNYSVLTTSRDNGVTNFVTSLSATLSTKTTTALEVICARRDNGSLIDTSEYNVAIFR